MEMRQRQQLFNRARQWGLLPAAGLPSVRQLSDNNPRVSTGDLPHVRGYLLHGDFTKHEVRLLIEQLLAR